MLLTVIKLFNILRKWTPGAMGSGNFQEFNDPRMKSDIHMILLHFSFSFLSLKPRIHKNNKWKTERRPTTDLGSGEHIHASKFSLIRM